MNKHYTRILLLSGMLLVCNIPIQAQWSIGVTIGGIAFHQGKVPNPDIYPWKLDKKGVGVIIAGINISISYRINNYLGVKAVQSLIFHDSGGKFAGISHIGLQLHDDIVGMKWEDHHTSMSIGPFWYYRKNWNTIPGYNHDPGFITLDKEGIWERKFVWYGGFFRYNYSFSENYDFAVDVLPGFPHVYGFSAGINSRIN